MLNAILIFNGSEAVKGQREIEGRKASRRRVLCRTWRTIAPCQRWMVRKTSHGGIILIFCPSANFVCFECSDSESISDVPTKRATSNLWLWAHHHQLKTRYQALPRIFLAGEPQELEPEPFFPSSLWQRNGWHFAPGLEDGSGVNQGWYNVDKPLDCLDK